MGLAPGVWWQKSEQGKKGTISAYNVPTLEVSWEMYGIKTKNYDKEWKQNLMHLGSFHWTIEY
jgi:hypothetical protein